MSTVDEELAKSRRPLNSRKWGWTNHAAARLARAGVAPNHISLFSIACAAFAAAALIGTRYAASPWLDALLYLLAIVGVQGRLLCNLFDGMVAVEGGRRTPAGELFNETPDRVADTLILVAAGYAADPVYGPTLGWCAALLAMATAYVRVLGKACGAGVYFTGPMAKQQRMAWMTFASFCASMLRLFRANDRIPGWDRQQMSWLLLLICVGCIPTLWRRVEQVAADLNARASA